MRRKIFILSFIVSVFLTFKSHAEKAHPDTVRTGIYITSIHDIDFKQKEYTVNFWLWMKYKNKDFDFWQNIEVPQAKTVTKSFLTGDTTKERVYVLMKLQCVMKDSWKIGSFPFDHQSLRLSIENSQFDAKSLVFVKDTVGQHYGKFSLNGWNIDSFNISTGVKKYETDFGDENLEKPHSEYSSFKVKIGIEREAFGLFWKMFLGMYIAFLIAYVCFYIHADNIDSRFGLSVGALFAVIGNKYVVDSSLPESTTFTLVDSLHGLTLLFILCVVASSVYALKLVKRGELDKANRFDMIAAQVLLLTYGIANAYYIYSAYQG